MKIKFVNSETGDIRYAAQGINWFLLLTAPLFGITLFRYKFRRSGMAMLLAGGFLFIGILIFYLISSSYAAAYPYAMGMNETEPSYFMYIWNMLDIDYDDMLEFFLTYSILLIIFMTIFSSFIAVSANKWAAENLRDLGYKAAVTDTITLNALKKEWNFSNNDFIIEK